MPILGLWALLEHVHLWKTGNSQNHYIYHVIKLLVSLSIVKVYKIIGGNHKYLYTVKYTTLDSVLHTS
jgi:replication initiation and membrane attachment protein DnaB